MDLDNKPDEANKGKPPTFADMMEANGGSKRIPKLMDQWEGLTEEGLIKLLASKVSATSRKIFHKTIYDKQSRSTEVEVVYSDPQPDHEIQMRALDVAIRLRDLYPAERKQVQVDGAVPVRSLTEEDRLEVEAMKEVIRRRIREKSLGDPG